MTRPIRSNLAVEVLSALNLESSDSNAVWGVGFGFGVQVRRVQPKDKKHLKSSFNVKVLLQSGPNEESGSGLGSKSLGWVRVGSRVRFGPLTLIQSK